MRYLLESMYLRPITRAGVMCKERGRRMRAGVMSQEPRQRIWILRDVMMTEFEIPPPGWGSPEDTHVEKDLNSLNSGLS